ncbi:type IV secretion system DNA-binding domain-containing protein [Trichlorobacter lovleyi]|uniref:type IV secretion system DNA-binding domain-containing protein n=1 Tax=Trichlorobacter lovleyi TaxID=313985 RepID=UPI003D0EF9C7
MSLERSRFSGTASLFNKLAQISFAVRFWMRIALPLALFVFIWRAAVELQPLGHGGGIKYLRITAYELFLAAGRPMPLNLLPKEHRDTAAVRHPAYLRLISVANHRIIIAGMLGLAAGGGVLLLGFFLARREAQEQTEDKFRRGSQLADSPKQLSRVLKLSEGPGEIKLGDVVLPRQAECRGILAVGMTGVGKTQLQNRILDVIVDRPNGGDRGIIFSVKGDDYLTTHWRPGDSVFCPADNRCLGWNLMDDVTDLADFDVIAASLVVHDDKVKTWSNGARMIVSGLLKFCYLSGQRSNRQVAAVFSQDVKGMRNCLRKVPGAESAAGLLADPTSAPANSFYITVCLFSRPLMLLKHLEGDWSIARWIKEGSGRIYLPATPRLREQLGGLYSVFIDLAIVHHLSLPKDPNRRIWYCIDELAAVGQISRLPELRNVGRDKGAGTIAGAQSFPQIDPIYTVDGRKALVGGFATKAIFKTDDEGTLEELSKKIGKQEIESSRENLSTSFNINKDGVTKMSENKDDVLVKPDEIKILPALHCYVQVTGYPAAKTQVAYKDWPIINPAHIPHPALSLEALSAEYTKQKEALEELSQTESSIPKSTALLED